ncbi:MAG: amino acid-binding ACT domain-containing protein, partial [Chloroflexi bacterium]|nr:amino acid-binding ACT domain-containing protein [Chloroflexota bacterium]
MILRNVPGTIADLGEAAGKAGVDLRGACGFESGGEGVMHVVVEGDVSALRQAFEEGGMEVRAEREVLVIDVDDTPGGLGRAMRRFADAGVNVDLVYLTADGRLVIGPDDVQRAQSVASG